MTREEVEGIVLDCLLKIKEAIKQYPEASSHVVCLSVWQDYVSAFQHTEDETDYTFYISDGRL